MYYSIKSIKSQLAQGSKYPRRNGDMNGLADNAGQTRANQKKVSGQSCALKRTFFGFLNDAKVGIDFGPFAIQIP